MRYRLQHKEQYVLPNILGNHSFPVHTYRWKDIAMSDDKEALVGMMPNDKEYRVTDTRAELDEVAQ